MSVYLSGIKGRDILVVWPRVEEYVRAALARGHADEDLDPYHVYERLITKDAQLWIVFTEAGEIPGCYITELIDHPKRRVLRFFIVAGVHYDEWKHLTREIEIWGAEQGAEAVEAIGRVGWSRVIQGDGYMEISRVYRKSLEGVETDADSYENGLADRA